MADVAADVKNLLDAVEHQRRMTHASVVIATTAILDNQLERGLKRALLPMSKNMYKQLFDSFRPLNTFSAKIVMAYGLGIITKNVYDELEKIRHIRNAFAHSSERLHFESPQIAPLFARLKRPRSKATKPVNVFMECAKAIDAVLEDYLLRMGERSP
jgi:DNA-binding MltR family transcriptional regulator